MENLDHPSPMLKWHIFAPSRLHPLSLPFFLGGGGRWRKEIIAPFYSVQDCSNRRAKALASVIFVVQSHQNTLISQDEN